MTELSPGVKGRTTVLLVEDDADARASLCRSLERAGYEMLATDSVVGALSQLDASSRLAAIVSDMVLGADEAGGISVLRGARERGVAAPVIVITAFASLDNVKQALNEGAAYLIEKPFRAGALLDAITRCTESHPDMGYVVDQALLRAGLTDKERNIARLVLKGLTSAEIARLEKNSDKTIRQHITRIYQKCEVTSRAEFFNHVFAW